VSRSNRFRLFDWAMSEFFKWVLERLNKAETPEDVKIKLLNLVYDRMCQYSVHFLERLEEEGLQGPEDIKLNYLIGKFHLGCHKDECWARYTLDLLMGAGRHDGEILERLWSELNKSKSTIRSLSESHREEHVDELLQNNNVQKLVNGGMLL